MKDDRTLTPVVLPGGLLLDVPQDWEQVEHPAADLCLREGVDAWDTIGFRANLVVTSGQVGTSFGDWQVAVEDELDASLNGYYLLDFDVVPVAGSDGSYRLATYSHEGTPVTFQQWSRLAGSEAVCVTLTVANAAYDTIADDFSEIAASLRTNGAESPR